ncbi:asparaginase [Haladaptatus sp. YSMS36]|uniref:asparaginase n=1 Tax=Haladaptatus sp. YSMS36 TaxID=3033384 RepID=UPI0023E8BDC3|nr:asparaginase [Haladaptatus sp. YSMS36]
MTPHIAVLSTGGTIASTGTDKGATPTRAGDELVEAVPGLTDHADISVEEVAQISSFALGFDTMATIVRRVRELAAEGVDGVVVTHGTDTMEESAYFVDVVAGDTIPVVFTGAQRRGDEPGADGPANLLTAVRAASHERVREAGGAYIAFADSLYSARTVTKGHTSNLDTFYAPDAGPVANVLRGYVRFFREPGSESVSIPATDVTARVEMVKSAAGVDGWQIERALEDGVSGIVLEGMGLGNTTPGLETAAAEAIDRGVPVVVTSRCHGGAVNGIYGKEGGARTLEEHGAILGGDLPAQKARITLALALSATDDPEEARELVATAAMSAI